MLSNNNNQLKLKSDLPIRKIDKTNEDQGKTK